MSRLTSPIDDPNHIVDRREIDQAFTSTDPTKKINEADHNFLISQQAEMSKPGEEAFKKGMESFFKDNSEVISPHFGKLMGIFTVEPSVADKVAVQNAKEEYIRQGNILKQTGKDPNSLNDPSSPNYFGKQLPRFQVDAAGALKDPNASYAIHDTQIANAAQHIKNIESSGGNYSAKGVDVIDKKTGAVDNAYGAYQVMGKNVGNWTQQYYGTRLTPREFLANKEAQDIVFEGQFGKYMKQYGPEGAARAWYAGEGGMNNLGATDANHKLTVAQYGYKFSAQRDGIQFVEPGMTPAEAAAKFPGQVIMTPDGVRLTAPGKKIVPPPPGASVSR
jgi:hypothetical protein